MKSIYLQARNFSFAAGISAVFSVLPTTSAFATNGQLPACVGTYKCAMGGAGLAIASDASATATNPALAVRMGNEAIISAGWFHADVRGNAVGTHGYDGVQSSDASDFLNLSLAVNKRINDKFAINFAVYPGAGGGTDWSRRRTDPGAVPAGSKGGLDHMMEWKMLHAQLALAWAPTKDTALGIGLVAANSTMKTDSLDNSFAAPSPGPTSSRNSVFGFGFQIGGVWDYTEQVSFGAKYHSKVWVERFRNYVNTFNSSVDRPAIASVGVSIKPDDKFNLAFDVKHVENSSVKVISSAPEADGGFGWKNQLIFMVGGQYKVTDDLTVRLGYNYGNSPIDEQHLFANFLLPAIVTHHVTAGASYNLSEAFEIGFSSYITENAKTTDDGSGDGFSRANAGSWVQHQQYGAQASLKYRF